jgi:outer membrane protein assembly factor BamB
MRQRPALIAMAAVAVGAVVLLLALGADDERFARAPVAEQLTPVAVRTGAPAPAEVPAVPPEVTAAASEWPLPNRDYANTRATDDAEIDAGNVRTLGVAWRRKLHGATHWGAAASGPLIAGGVVYFQDLRSDVWALDLRDGVTRWRATVDSPAFGPNGPAIGWGKLYAQDGGDRLLAFDLATGAPAWSRVLSGPTGAQQPTAYGGLIQTGLVAGRDRRLPEHVYRMELLADGSSGWVYGVRADDGRIVWDFRTVTPGNWGNARLNSGGGVWFPPAVDPASGRVFWSTGNPAPGPGTIDYPNASSRPGPNRWTNSVLAFDARSGERSWSRQLQPHDLLHHDLQSSPILVEAGGRRLLIASGKGGVVFALDRDDGRLLWSTPIGVHRNDGLKRLPDDDSPVWVTPGFWGGIETPGAAAEGTLYFLTENLATPYTATAWRSETASQTVQNHEGRTPLDKGTSELVALDAATGRVRWRHPFPMVGFGGATVVNDLVFTATYDGTVYALRRDDGSVAWSGNLGAGVNAWPAVADDTIVWPAGLGRNPALVALRLGARPRSETAPRTRVAAGER